MQGMEEYKMLIIIQFQYKSHLDC